MQQEYLKEDEENKNEVRVVELEEKTNKIIVSFFTMLNAFDYVNQNSNGQTKWDERQGTIVLSKNLSFINYIMIILMILIEIGDAIWNSIV